MEDKSPGVFSTHTLHKGGKTTAHCVIIADAEQIETMFYALAESYSEVIPSVLNGIFAALDKEQPGFAEHMNETISNFKPK